MRKQGIFSPLSWFAGFFLLASLILASLQLVQYSRIRATYPPGLTIAGIPVAGLNRQEASERIIQGYSVPVELIYNDFIIHMEPSLVDFQLDLESMLAAADIQRTQQVFWQGFWDYLWNRQSRASEVPLRSSFSETRLRVYLEQEISPRYDQPPLPAMPVVGTVNFTPGQPGTALDIDGAVLLIENALYSLDNRSVVLPLRRTSPPRPAFQNLEVLLKQTIDLAGFDGLTGIYLLDLQNAQELHFAYRQASNVPVNPDIAFTASSIIKIPIMVSAFRRIGDQPDQETLKLLEDMIDKSGNEAADWLMDRVIATNRSPLVIQDDMQAIGLQNTFLAGYFYAGAPLLAFVDTPANTRTDINTDPDLYSQTTPSDIGMLLSDIYQCSQSGGGALLASFPGEITQEECRLMIDYLARNKIGVLIEAGVPDGTRVAHKHGWVTYQGIINTIGDAAIVFTPGGNFVLVIFVYHPQQLIWDSASRLVADLATAVYNYYNLPQ
ncbi:MAG: serine hydrolase [Anaerolineales bacterium]|nr:serine hydrolase [Anaerolineales bacterium]